VTLSADHHLEVSHIDAGEIVRPLNANAVPGNIDDRTGLIIDEMMMGFYVGIKHRYPLGEGKLFEETLLHKEMQRVVDRCSRQGGKRRCDGMKDLFGRRMLFRHKHVIRNRNPLSGGLDGVGAEEFDDLFHSDIWNKSKVGRRQDF